MKNRPQNVHFHSFLHVLQTKIGKSSTKYDPPYFRATQKLPSPKNPTLF